jgi:hypothetical protein
MQIFMNICLPDPYDTGDWNPETGEWFPTIHLPIVEEDEDED